LAEIGAAAVVPIVVAFDEGVLLVGIELTVLPRVGASQMRAGILHPKTIALVVGCFAPRLTIVVPATVIPIPIPAGNVRDQRETRFLGIFLDRPPELPVDSVVPRGVWHNDAFAKTRCDSEQPLAASSIVQSWL
jgi:hypothetical protein